jgi:hypothetical protein
MFTSLLRQSRAKSVHSPLKARLGLDAFEDRVVPANISFNSGVLLVEADQTTNDYVRITPIGASGDGSTGVKLVTNVQGSLQTMTFGGDGDPVTNIALDMKDGNDFVSVASLKQTIVLVGEGNGNNVVLLGDTLAAGVLAGSGQNVIAVGNSTLPDAFGSFNLPGFASEAVFVGWGYSFADGGRAVFLAGNTGNANDNLVLVGSKTGFRTFVDVVGTGNNLILTGNGDDGVSVIGGGNNLIFTGAGNDLVRIQGDGDNWVCTGSGDDTVEINGNGNNHVGAGNGANNVTVNGNGNNSVCARGSGSITVNGSGQNFVHTGCGSTATVALNGAGAGSVVCADEFTSVFVDGVQVTEPGAVGNVTVNFH